MNLLRKILLTPFVIVFAILFGVVQFLITIVEFVIDFWNDEL